MLNIVIVLAVIKMPPHTTLRQRVQAAFKRTTTGTNTPNVRITLDWDTVKAEDKTLVHQVTDNTAHLHCGSDTSASLLTELLLDLMLGSAVAS